MARSTLAEDWDVIVVGAGGAGLAAAAEAAAHGCRVLLLEKNAQPGGSTACSLGILTEPSVIAQQPMLTEQDGDGQASPIAARHAAAELRDNPELRQIVREQYGGALAWLRSLGVVFAGPSPKPAEGVAAAQTVVPNARALIQRLVRHCVRGGVALHTRSRVVGLVIEGGRVVGVECATERGKRSFRAHRGVVLASGDYSGDRSLKSHFSRPDVADLEPVVASCTGDGHKLALALGASVMNGGRVCAPLLAFVPPKRPTRLARLAGGPALARPIALSCRYLPAPLMRRLTMGFVTTALAPAPRLFEHGAILVNVEGRRFCEERSQPASEVPKQPYRIAFIVLDRELAERFEAWPNCISTAPGIGHTYFSDHRRRGAMVREARTVEKLAEALGVPTQTLARTIAHYNADARGTRPALSRPPFFALGPVKSYCAYTDGGLRVSERLEVLSGSGSPIPGLFAAGAAGQGGLLLDGQGDRLAWAFVSGRVAGRTVAAAERAMSEVLA